MAVLTRTDQELRDDVQGHLLGDARVNGLDIAVDAHDGRVTLTGSVPSYFAHHAATDCARAVAGVRSVDNQLAISPEPAVVPTDDDLQANARNLLQWSADIDADDILVHVINGVVRLEGTVDAFWKKLHAATLVGSLAGVRAIDNDLAIVPSERVEDKVIAERILVGLKRSWLVSEDTINLVVENGVVTMTGTVPDLAAQSAALTAARHVLGVTQVIDELTVERAARA